MFCSNCGKQLQDNVKFCCYCGAAQAQPAVPAANICANCGRAYEENEAFCARCGTARNVSAGSAAAQPAAAQPVYAAQPVRPVQPQVNYNANPYNTAVNYAAVQPVKIGGGARFLAILPLILTVLSMLLYAVDYFSYFPVREKYIIRFFEVYGVAFVISMIVPIICLINGVQSKPSKGGCIVGAVFSGVFLFAQVVINVLSLMDVPLDFYIGNVYIYDLINGSYIVNILRGIYYVGFDYVNIFQLVEFLFPIKNIIAFVSMLVIASKARK